MILFRVGSGQVNGNSDNKANSAQLELSFATDKQQLLDFKNKPDLKICVILKIWIQNRFSLPLSSPTHLTNVVFLPSPFLMMMNLGWTQLMDEFFQKEILSIFTLLLNLKKSILKSC